MSEIQRSFSTPRPPAMRKANLPVTIGLLVLIAAVAYGIYFWVGRRVVVGPGEVLVLIRKDASRSLPGDQIIIPHRPDPANAKALEEWEQKYGDCNGILEEVFATGTYFKFSPFDYEREVRPLVVVEQKKVGIVVKKFGEPLPAGQVMADESLNHRGPLNRVLQPGSYYEYSNPYAYEVRQIDPIQIEPGHRGVVTMMAGPHTKSYNPYLVGIGEQGVQPATEKEGWLFINPYIKRLTSIQVQSQPFQMSGADSIRFPSSDSFEIRMEGIVEWAIIPEQLPLTYVQYGEGEGLIVPLEKRVILPYSRSFSRTVGSQYSARDFISGDTKIRFQEEFEKKLREACAKQGIQILQARVRDIIPPDDIKNPINEREIARQQVAMIQQQVKVAKSQAELATQTEMAGQNQMIGEANKQVVTIIKKAEQVRDVQITKSNQDLAVAKLKLEAAQRQADAIVARGKAEADVILLQKQAEAEPLKQQIAAFGDGQAYAQFFFYEKLAPSIKSILTNTDGPIADVFKQFANPVKQGGGK